MSYSVKDSFSLEGRVIVITGGVGLLGVKHAEAVAEVGGIPILLDIDQARLDQVVTSLRSDYGVDALGLMCDITSKHNVAECLDNALAKYQRIDGLVNNAANDPKVGSDADAKKLTRFENLSKEFWEKDIGVGLTGAFYCAQIFGHYMATHGGGVIVNIASDLAIIAPDQRLYRVEGLAEESQPVKPVTYSVVKSSCWLDQVSCYLLG